MLIGTTYSTKQAKHLSLDSEAAFRELLAMNFDIVRLGCYWNEIEHKPGIYDFSTITNQLDLCEKTGTKVLITVGMKAPQWPEFYIPSWITAATDMHAVAPFVYKFVEQTTTILKHYSCIIAWQVENEPFDPSGPRNVAIPEDVVAEEVRVVKQLDPTRKILINLWGNDLTERASLPTAEKFADIIGLDLYYKQFLTKQLGISFHAGPRDTDHAIKQAIDKTKKAFWITELQAEPWEKNDAAYRADKPKSMNASLLKQNFARAKHLQPEALLLWGAEYWFWKKSHGDSSMWNTVIKLIEQERVNR